MRALTLTQPWAGLVASGVKLVENRPRHMIKRDDVGKRFVIHASREVDHEVYTRIYQLAPELGLAVEDIASNECLGRWYQLSRITSAAIAIATLDAVIEGPARGLEGWLAADQRRWYFGPIGYVLRDVIVLPKAVPCRGRQGFWTLNGDTERAVVEQIAAAVNESAAR